MIKTSFRAMMVDKKPRILYIDPRKAPLLEGNYAKAYARHIKKIPDCLVELHTHVMGINRHTFVSPNYG